MSEECDGLQTHQLRANRSVLHIWLRLLTCSRGHVLRSRSWRSASSRCLPAPRLQFPPATGAIVRDNLLEHCREGMGVDLLALPNCDGTGGLVAVSASDDAVWVGHDPAIVQEDIDPVLSRKQRTDVAFERKVRLARALNGLHQLRIRGMSQVADLTADGLLPLGQAFDVDIDPWVCVVSRHWFITPRYSMTRHFPYHSDKLSYLSATVRIDRVSLSSRNQEFSGR